MELGKERLRGGISSGFVRRFRVGLVEWVDLFKGVGIG